MLKSQRILLYNILFFYSNTIFAQNDFYTHTGQAFRLTEKGASFLAALPLKCLDKEFPYKTGITFMDSSAVARPKDYHPAFYGCYDWHSSVHGHWMLIKLLKQFPQLPEASIIRTRLESHLSFENIQKEMAIFKSDNLGFERTYGWGWLLYLQRELLSWDDPLGRSLSKNVQPLTTMLSAEWVKYLGKIAYPIRVGEHTNLAFGLSFAWDYALQAKDTALQRAVKETAMRFYFRDKACPVSWEPGGADFLSPCLEEAKLMSRLLNGPAYQQWLQQFMPGLLDKPGYLFTMAVVNDRTDGKLGHLDGLNLSRTAGMLEIAAKLPEKNAKPLRTAGAHFLETALPHVASGNYVGEHWLASFAVYALSVGR